MNTKQPTVTGEGTVPRTTKLDFIGYIECARIYDTDEAEEYHAEQEESDRAAGRD